MKKKWAQFWIGKVWGTYGVSKERACQARERQRSAHLLGARWESLDTKGVVGTDTILGWVEGMWRGWLEIVPGPSPASRGWWHERTRRNEVNLWELMGLSFKSVLKAALHSGCSLAGVHTSSLDVLSSWLGAWTKALSECPPTNVEIKRFFLHSMENSADCGRRSPWAAFRATQGLSLAEFHKVRSNRKWSIL